MLLVASCDYFGERPIQNGSGDVKEIITLSDSIREQIIKQDSLYAGLIAKIDTLTWELNENKQKNVDIQQDVDKLKKPGNLWFYVTIIALIFAIIAFVVVINKPSKKIIDERFKKYEEKLKDLSQQRNGIGQSYRNTGGNSRNVSQNSPYTQQLESRLLKIERTINDLKNDKRAQDNNLCDNNKERGFAEEGYATINSGRYFLDISDYKKEVSVFKIELKSSIDGEFDIISLDKIKNRNGWQDVVEYTGNSTMADATNYKVIDKGICKKIADNVWEVTRKLKIKISK